MLSILPHPARVGPKIVAATMSKAALLSGEPVEPNGDFRNLPTDLAGDVTSFDATKRPAEKLSKKAAHKAALARAVSARGGKTDPLILPQIAQLSHVVAVLLNSRLDFITDANRPRLLFLPFPEPADDGWLRALRDHQKIMFVVDVYVEHVCPSLPRAPYFAGWSNDSPTADCVMSPTNNLSAPSIER